MASTPSEQKFWQNFVRQQSTQSSSTSTKFWTTSISHKYVNGVTVLAVVCIGLALGVGIVA